MYHLINRTYVEIESRIKRIDHPYATISRQIGYEHIPFEDEEVSEQLGYVTSLDAMDKDDAEKFFSKLFGIEDKIFIFVDGETYLRIYAMMIKTVMPNITLEVFRRVMLCKKATFQVSLLNNNRPRTNIFAEVVINEQTVKGLFETTEKHQQLFSDLVWSSSDHLSMEWQILRLITEDRTGSLPERFKAILRRIALANSYDALDVWGRRITDPSTWDFCGADIETLIGGHNVFEGALNFQYVNSDVFLQPGVFAQSYSDEWVMGLLAELIQVLDYCDEGPTADRTRMIHRMMTSNEDLNDPNALKRRAMQMFKGERLLALPNADSGKYDENLIRYLLTEDPGVLKECVRWN